MLEVTEERNDPSELRDDDDDDDDDDWERVICFPTVKLDKMHGQRPYWILSKMPPGLRLISIVCPSFVPILVKVSQFAVSLCRKAPL